MNKVIKKQAEQLVKDAAKGLELLNEHREGKISREEFAESYAAIYENLGYMESTREWAFDQTLNELPDSSSGSFISAIKDMESIFASLGEDVIDENWDELMSMVKANIILG